MLRIPINTHKRLQRGEIPQAYAVINTHLGYRAYGDKALEAVFADTPVLLDGSWSLGGAETLSGGAIETLEKSARVLNFSSFERTISPLKDDLLTAYSAKQKQHLSLQLNNTDGYFSRLLAQEPFLGREVKIYLGFEAEPQSTHLSIFAGLISELSVLPVLTIEADER